MQFAAATAATAPPNVASPPLRGRMAVDWAPVHDTLSALRAGHESLDLFVAQLFGELESMRDRLEQGERRLREERAQFAEARERFAAERAQWEATRGQPSPEQSAKTNELARERMQLETELEAVRHRCVEMSETIAEQKRHLTDERAEWTAEFRQLRKILDKQSQVLSQRVETGAVAAHAAIQHGSGVWPALDPSTINGPIPTNNAFSGHVAIDDAVSSHHAHHNGHGQNGVAVTEPRPATDPVLGSVISQFQMLQKDAARRRAQQGKGK